MNCSSSDLSFSCRITFVGGKQLSSTGSGYKEGEIKVYPTPPPDKTPTPAAVTPTTPTDASKSNGAEEELELEPVGEWLGHQRVCSCGLTIGMIEGEGVVTIRLGVYVW